MSEDKALVGPGFVAVVLDVPFAVSIPNGGYRTRDPEKGVACIEVTLKEGSTTFFRNRPIIGPTSFKELQIAAQRYTRPRPDHSYVATSILADGTEKATLNVHLGEDGGFAECKYFSCLTVTFLVDDLSIVSEGDKAKQRVRSILNPFLDKYRLLNEDYKVSRLPTEGSFYLASYHTSPLHDDELGMSSLCLFNGLSKKPREWRTAPGRGGVNTLSLNSYELLGPRGQLSEEMLAVFESLAIEDYSVPLYYELILEALRCLQKSRDFRLAILHAETAFEVYVSDALVKIMRDSGMEEQSAMMKLETQEYWGIKKRLRRLDEWTETHCKSRELQFVPFVGSEVFGMWDSKLNANRNRAIHEGVGAFQYQDASDAIGIAKECILLLEQRIPSIAHWIRLNCSIAHFREIVGRIDF